MCSRNTLEVHCVRMLLVTSEAKRTCGTLKDKKRPEKIHAAKHWFLKHVLFKSTRHVAALKVKYTLN